MNTVKVCNPAAVQPFETFVQETTTHVCLPDGVDYQLFYQVKEPGELIIEAEGKQIYAKPVDPSEHFLDLKEALNLTQPVRSIFANLIGGTPVARPQRARDFKVIIRRGTGADAVVSATYDFQLLSPAEYKLAHAKYLGRSPICPVATFPYRFVVDWESDPGRHCWNCRYSIAAEAKTCPHCGADQDNIAAGS